MTEFSKIFLMIVNMSLTAGILVPIVLIARVLLSKAPKSFSYVLWGIVGIRLICPISFSTIFSVFNLPVVKENVVLKQVAVSPGGTLNAQMIASPQTFSGTVRKVGEVTGNSAGIMKIAAVIWIVGIAVFLIYESISWIKLKNQVSQSVKYKDNIYECDRISSPFVMGIIRPKIYLPFCLTDKERKYVLLHEQYHVKRKDYLVKFFAVILLTIYWFQPLIWIAFRGMSRDMEMSCDERVLQKLGDTIKTDYSDSLLAFAVGRKVPVISPLAFGESSVKSRIKNVLSFQKYGRFAMAGALVICVIVIILGTANGKTDSQLLLKQNENSQTRAEELYAAKIPYIGEASAVGKLLELLDIRSLGSCTMELQTSEKPYMLRLNFEKEPENPSGFHSRMVKNAVILNVLIENAGEVQWSYPVNNGEERYVWSCDLEYAKVLLGGENVKQFAESEEAVQKMLEKLAVMFSTETNLVTRTKSGYLTPGGEIYRYRLVLTGRSLNAVRDSVLVVYTNEKGLTFSTVQQVMFSSNSSDFQEHPMYVSLSESPDYIETISEE